MDNDEGSCDVVKEAVNLSTCTFNKCLLHNIADSGWDLGISRVSIVHVNN